MVFYAKARATTNMKSVGVMGDGRIVNEVLHVNRVLYDITSKPLATVELE